ncbi:hypothetical protein ACFVVM_18180 [Nocardia sp. NPDC058176]|uniref:hypothetical protein n=1 Tax=Nocardia sp. NPDC058176 TaxID=3346368 RepID=UPI0036DB70B6
MIARRLTTATLAIAAAAVLTGISAPAASAGSAVIDILNPLVNAGAATGSGQLIISGSNEAATSTGSSQAAGLLFCGLLSLSNGNHPTICDTGIVG